MAQSSRIWNSAQFLLLLLLLLPPAPPLQLPLLKRRKLCVSLLAWACRMHVRIATFGGWQSLGLLSPGHSMLHCPEGRHCLACRACLHLGRGKEMKVTVEWWLALCSFVHVVKSLYFTSHKIIIFVIYYILISAPEVKSHSRFLEFCKRIGKAGDIDAFLEGECCPTVACMEWGRICRWLLGTGFLPFLKWQKTGSTTITNGECYQWPQIRGLIKMKYNKSVLFLSFFSDWTSRAHARVTFSKWLGTSVCAWHSRRKRECSA